MHTTCLAERVTHPNEQASLKGIFLLEFMTVISYTHKRVWICKAWVSAQDLHSAPGFFNKDASESEFINYHLSLKDALPFLSLYTLKVTSNT